MTWRAEYPEVSPEAVAAFEAMQDAIGVVAGENPYLPLAATLEGGVSSYAIVVASDSTACWSEDITYSGVDSWVTKFGQGLAAMYPDLRVQLRLWSDVTQSYPDWTVLQAAGGERGVTFAGPGNGNGRYTPAAYMAEMADLDVAVKVKLADWTPAALQTLAARWAATPNRSWNFCVTNTGALFLQWSTTGSDAINLTTPVLTGIADGTTKWVRVTLDVDNGASGYTANFYTSDDGVTWTNVYTKTNAGVTSIYSPGANADYIIGSQVGTTATLAGTIYAVRMASTINGPNFAPQPVEAWQRYTVSNDGTGLEGSPTLYITNASKPGAWVDYYDATRLPKMIPVAWPALGILAHGHNGARAVGKFATDQLDTVLAAFRARAPQIDWLLGTENPRYGTNTDEDMDKRRVSFMSWARRNALQLVDTYSPFKRDPRFPLGLLYDEAGGRVHPNATGQQVLADVHMKAFKRARTVVRG